jgi:transcriptional/translational regulatory protein YebC/TACO1
MFDRVGDIIYPAGVTNADAMFEAGLEAGASNVESGESHEITTTPDDFAAVRSALVAKFGEPEKSGLVWKPNVMAPINEEQATDVLELIEALEENDDVQHVTTNVEVSEQVMQKLMAAG